MRRMAAPAVVGQAASMGLGDRVSAWGLLFFLAIAAWRWGGLRRSDGSWFALAAGVLAAWLLLPLSRPAAAASHRWWCKDVYFWSGLLFLAYLGVQWWNAGRQLVYDPVVGRWGFTAPRHPTLPWAIGRDEAAQMFHWFFPAWVVGLCARSPKISRAGLGLVVRGLIASAGALALFGLVQFLSGTRAVYWILPMKDDFFASFTYANHAAAYFLLLAALSAGVLFRQLFRRDRLVRTAEKAWLTGTLLLCLVGANLSLSRAGVILSWMLALEIAAYGLIHGWRWLRATARVNLAAAVLAAAIGLVIVVSGTGGEAIRGEFAMKLRPIRQALPGVETVNLDLSDRPRLWSTAWSMLQDHPWWGVGGWGFRHLAAFYLPQELWGYLGRNPGRANVHCDPLQFLVEFGCVGAGLMTLAVSALVVALFTPGLHRGALFTMTCSGLFLVAVFSLIDLTFRCPAVLWTWTAMAAALPRLTDRERTPGLVPGGGSSGLWATAGQGILITP